MIRKLRFLELEANVTWSEEGQKSTKFFFTLEERHTIENRVKTLLVGDEVLKNKPESIKTYILFIKSFYPKITTFLDKRFCNIYYAKTFRN